MTTHQDTKSSISYEEVNEDILSIITRTGTGYYVLTACLAVMSVSLFFLPWIYQIYTGQGVTGLNSQVFWGVYLVNFVFWVGVAHAGTLISAMLYITHTPWRRAISRGAETITLFSLVMVPLFVFIHMGRSWNFYWTFPYPNQRELWTSFISPLTFDVFAIGAYTTSSIIFLYLGLIPDLGVLSRNITGWRKKLYNTISIGWCGTDEQWHIHTRTSMFFSAFIMPLVVSVHSVVSWDFALSVVPGFSKTVFAPYFVTGALLSGFAAILLILSIMREVYPITKRYITDYHYDRITLFVMILSLVWSYFTFLEIATDLYANTSEGIEHLKFKITAPPYLQLFAFMIFSNAIMPLTYIFKKLRPSIFGRFVVPIFIIIGMWLERYLIIPNSLSRKFLPYIWRDYMPSWVEISITAGGFLGFTTLFMIYIKIFPIISIFDVKKDIGVPMKKRR